MKQLIRKILKEQEEIINVPDLDFFDGDWEQLLEFTRGRPFKVHEDLNLKKFCPETLGNLISVYGELNLNYCENITSLGNLEYVRKDLYLERCENLESIGNLKHVGDVLSVFGCEKLTSLGSLEFVGGFLMASACYELKSLGNLKYVGGNLHLRNTPIADMYSESEIRRMVEVKGDIYK
jgi:hypothetical protein